MQKTEEIFHDLLNRFSVNFAQKINNRQMDRQRNNLQYLYIDADNTTISITNNNMIMIRINKLANN